MWTAALNLVARTANFSSMMSGAGNVARAFGNQVTSSMSKAMMASNIAQKAFSGLTQAFFQATAQAKQFTNIASRLNLKPTEVAQLAEAAEDAGIPLMSLSKGMRDIQSFGAKGLKGALSKDLKEAAQQLNLSQADFKVLAAGGRDAMTLMATKMREVGDDATQLLITQKLHARNAQFLGQIYDKSAQELREMFTTQTVSSDATIAANKKIYDSIDRIKDRWNVFLAWLVARFQWVVQAIDYITEGMERLGEVLGGGWEWLKDGADRLGDFAEAFATALRGDNAEAGSLLKKWWEREKNAWKDTVKGISEWSASILRRQVEATISIMPDWMLRLFGQNRSDLEKAAERMKTIKAPEQTDEEKKAAQNVRDEIKANEEKRRWEEASNEQRAEILAERRRLILEEAEASKKSFEDAEKAKMEQMDKQWAIDPEAYKASAAFLLTRKKLLELQEQELENEREIAKAEKERREEAEKAAKEKLIADRESAKTQRGLQDELFDAQVELTRRNLEDDKASAVEKAQFELAVEQEKMSRLQREMIIAYREGNTERQQELQRDIIGQGLTLDAASRAVNAAQREDEKRRQEELLAGVAGVGDSLTAVGGGGALLLGPMDVAKSQLAVQREMNANLVAIRNQTANRTAGNVTYASSKAVIKQ